MTLHPSIAHIPLPAQIARLPRDHRGFPVPWFVAWVEGQADHRMVDARKVRPALTEHRCWTCGDVLGRQLAFLLGPMCVVSRTVSEPPSHRACAEYAVQACPFLSRPEAHRRDAGKPAEAQPAAGMAIQRNPGVICLWMTRTFRPFSAWAGQPGLLFQVGDPTEVRWYCAGRTATRPEVLDALESGMLVQQPLAVQEGPDAERAYALRVVQALQYAPAA